MNQMKDERLITDVTIRDARLSQKTELDLALLADQLLSIAEELRRNNDIASGSRLPRDEATALMQSRELFNEALSPGGKRCDFSEPSAPRQSHLNSAKAAYTHRRARESIFGDAELFGEPAWDIMLDLYIAFVEDKHVSVSSACIGSAAPPTTGLRWLGVLAENELILREHDPEDQRRVLVRLTQRGVTAMDEYFTRTGAER